MSTLGSTPVPTRTLWELTYSSAATIFACIWVSVHPNVPARTRDVRFSGGWKVRVRLKFIALCSGRLKDLCSEGLKNRILLMLIAFIAPEIIVLFALRQLVVAYTLYKSTSLNLGKLNHAVSMTDNVQ
jgi:hypothetical protein